MAPTKAPKKTFDSKLRTHSKCLIMNLETQFGQMARAKKKKNLHGVNSFWHAMAPTKAPKKTFDFKLGTRSKCLILNLETHFGQMARTKKFFAWC